MPDLRYTIDRLTERLLEGLEDWRQSHGETWQSVRDTLNDLSEHDIAEWWENYCLDGEGHADES